MSAISYRKKGRAAFLRAARPFSFRTGPADAGRGSGESSAEEDRSKMGGFRRTLALGEDRAQVAGALLVGEDRAEVILACFAADQGEAQVAACDGAEVQPVGIKE